VPTLQKAVDTCNSASGNIDECKIFDFVTREAAEACKIPVSVDEQVFGILGALPGCNPVQNGPNKAVAKPGCGAPTSISSPQMPFTDLTDSRGFKYVGCGPDIAGQPRTLLGDDIHDPEGMTIERCIDHCRSKGFSIAGVEFSKQCFCDNHIPTDRLPSPGLVGNCGMPCTGDDKQICGGPGLISLYQECGDKCENAPVPFINGSAGIVSPISAPNLSRPVSVAIGSGSQNAAGNIAGANKSPSLKLETVKDDSKSKKGGRKSSHRAVSSHHFRVAHN
jgi:hypothetical protein